MLRLRSLLKSMPSPSEILQGPVRYFSKSGRKWSITAETVPGKEGELAKDVMLYRHEQPRNIGFVSVFAFAQGAFWTLVGRNMWSMKDLPVETEKAAPFWRRVNWGSPAIKYTMAATSFLIGTLSVTIGSFYVLRSVRYLVLRKNREMVSIVTFTPFGRNRFIEVPLNEISCRGSRMQGGNMPLRIKGKFFMFLVDTKSGVFLNTRLFDQTVGINRKL